MGVANWSTIEDAIQSQIAAGAGLAGSAVRWGFQSRDSIVSGDSIVLEQMTGPRGFGQPEESEIDNPSPSAGNEIVLRSHSLVEFDIRIHIFTMTPVGNGSALAQAANLRGYLERESVTDALAAANVALVSVEQAQRVPLVVETEYQDRSLFAVKFRTLDGNEQTTTWIEKAEWSAVLT